MMKIKCFMVAREEDRHGDQQFRNLETDEIYRRPSDIPAGGIWNAVWFINQDKARIYKDHQHTLGMRDGQCLQVMTPGGQAFIDARASNCGSPDEPLGENEGEHFCWIRHGTAPNLTVDKTGRSCSAGAGSFVVGKWHGFLRDGYLVDA